MWLFFFLRYKFKILNLDFNLKLNLKYYFDIWFILIEIMCIFSGESKCCYVKLKIVLIMFFFCSVFGSDENNCVFVFFVFVIFL